MSDLDALARGILAFVCEHSEFHECEAEIRSVLARAVAAEREACAQTADDYDGNGVNQHDMYAQLGDAGLTLREIAAAIRARGAKPGEGA